MIPRILVVTAAVAVAALPFVVDARTTVSVVELGVGGTVHRTTTTRLLSESSSETATTVPGVQSLWRALHEKESKSSTVTGMTVVPDLFRRAERGVVIAVTGPQRREEMPFVAQLVEAAAAELTMAGSKSHELTTTTTPVSLETLLFSSETDAAETNAQVETLVQQLRAQADESKSTILLHVVLDDGEEEEEDVPWQGRLLEDENQDDAVAGDDDAVNDNNNNNNNNNGIYGYYNAYGEWVTNYRTSFQIQYFNLMLWTSVTLVVVTVYCNWITVNMPLMSDTLLFGEAAKMMGD